MSIRIGYPNATPESESVLDSHTADTADERTERFGHLPGDISPSVTRTRAYEIEVWS